MLSNRSGKPPGALSLGRTVLEHPGQQDSDDAVAPHSSEPEPTERGSLLQAQRHELHRQDAALDSMATTLQRLGELSRDIAVEVTSQEAVVEELESEISGTTAALDVATKRVNDLIKRSGGCGWFSALLILSIVAFILFLIIIFG